MDSIFNTIDELMGPAFVQFGRGNYYAVFSGNLLYNVEKTPCFVTQTKKIDRQLTTDSVNVAFTFEARRSTFRLPDAEADCPQRVRSRETDWCSNECDCAVLYIYPG